MKSLYACPLVGNVDKVKVRNVKVIPNKECAPKHKLLVMDMWFNTTKRNSSQERVYGIYKEEKTCEEYKSMVRDKVMEEEWKYLDINEHWQKMKKIMMETAQHICGMSKGPCRHKETCWWNEEVAKAVGEKKIKYGKWKRENSTEAWKEYKKSRQNARGLFPVQRKRNRKNVQVV